MSALGEEYNVTLISSNKEKLNDIAKAEGANAHFMPMQREISFLKDIWSLLIFICYFIKERPIMVHGNTPKASFLSMIAAYITRRPIRVYICVTDLDTKVIKALNVNCL